MGPPPIVTGLSPKEGPPGTRVTIRGEFLGLKPNDLIGLTICGCDCLLSAEWKSKNKIIARSGPGKGRGDIIVTTKSGGQGTSTVQFRGYHESYGPMKESAVWVEESGTVLTWGRRPLSPTSYAPPDPLGLSTEGDENKFPEDDLHELFPDSSGDLSAETFHPGWFLLEHHHTTTFEDLKAGTLFLKRKVDVQKEGQLSFLKDNTSSVMDQLDALILFKDRYEIDVQENGKEPLKRLENAIDQSIMEANKLFDDVLMRKDKADSTRAALTIMTRYKFLFQLPGTIDKNIKKKDYDLVINDYARAKNLFGKTDVPIFKKIILEVEKRINNLCLILHNKLQKMPLSVEEQKHLIRSLVNLEWSGDAAWDAITSRSNYITKQTIKIRDYHIHLETTESEQGKVSKNIKTTGNNDWWPARVSLCGSLSSLFTEALPDLWRLGQSYFSGELHGDKYQENHDKFKKMILTSVELFCQNIRMALLPITIDRYSNFEKSLWSSQTQPNLCNWLPHCLRDVRDTYSAFMKLDLPSEVLDIVSYLIHDLRIHCMIGLLKQALDNVKNFNKKETWKIEFDPRHGGITELPGMLEKTIYDAMNMIKETVLASCPREKLLFEVGSPAQKHLNSHFQDILIAYTKCLEKLAFSHDEQDSGQSPISVVLGASDVTMINNRLSDIDGHDGLSTNPPWQHRLLIILSNCRYTTDIIFPKIITFFEKNSYNKPIIPVETAKMSLRALDKAIMEAYLEQKSDPLVGTIEPSMYIGKFDWNTKIKPTDVRPYVKECINNLIAVHAEIHEISPSLTYIVLTPIIETVAEEIARLMIGCNGKFSLNGVIQAHIDIIVLRDSVMSFLTSKAKSLFGDALDAIPPLKNEEDKKLKQEIVQEFQKHMSLQLNSLKM